MPKMQRIFIRIDPETGDVLRRWFNARGTTLAGAIQDFLMDEYEKALDAEPEGKAEAEDAAAGAKAQDAATDVETRDATAGAYSDGPVAGSDSDVEVKADADAEA